MTPTWSHNNREIEIDEDIIGNLKSNICQTYGHLFEELQLSKKIQSFSAELNFAEI